MKLDDCPTRLLPLMFPVLLLGCSIAGAQQPPATQPAAAPLGICMLSGSEEYTSDKTLAQLKDHLEKSFNVHCTLSIPTKDDPFPGIEQLAACDVFVVFARRLKLTDDQVDRVKRYCAAGKGIVGIRTASHAFQTWLAFDKEVLGGSYQGHYGTDRPASLAFLDKAKDHPVLAGLKPFATNGKLYKNPNLAPDVLVLLTASTPDYSEPVAWVRQHNGARVFYTSLGVPDDFNDDSFRRLLVNAVFWTAHRSPQPRQ
jgi:type 1 glutamine amidotransferase